MNRRLLSFVLASASLPMTALAQGQLSAATRLYLHQYASQKAHGRPMRVSGNFLAPQMVNGQAMVKSFVTLSEGAQEPKLPEGATVTTRLGNLLIVAAPVDSLEQLAQLPGVKRVAVEQ